MSIKLEIEKGIPIPAPQTGRGRSPNKYRYPYRDMEVGDSFLVPGVLMSELTGMMSHAMKATGFRLSARTAEGGVRVWRVK